MCSFRNTVRRHHTPTVQEAPTSHTASINRLWLRWKSIHFQGILKHTYSLLGSSRGVTHSILWTQKLLSRSPMEHQRKQLWKQGVRGICASVTYLKVHAAPHAARAANLGDFRPRSELEHFLVRSGVQQGWVDGIATQRVCNLLSEGLHHERAVRRRGRRGEVRPRPDTPQSVKTTKIIVFDSQYVLCICRRQGCGIVYTRGLCIDLTADGHFKRTIVYNAPYIVYV